VADERNSELHQTGTIRYIAFRDFETKASMLKEEQKRRIKLYSVADRNRLKAARRRADAAEAARGRADIVQERNRALPHASQLVFPDREAVIPSE
jgi:hypothetical protein